MLNKRHWARFTVWLSDSCELQPFLLKLFAFLTNLHVLANHLNCPTSQSFSDSLCLVNLNPWLLNPNLWSVNLIIWCRCHWQLKVESDFVCLTVEFVASHILFY